jgi:AcrR family transcriptional regulator
VREATRQFKRGRLLEAAERLFHENGFQGASIESIVASLGVTKPFFYTYFDSKQAALDALLVGAADDMAAGAEAIFAVERAPEDQLRRFVEFYVRHSLENRAITAVFVKEEQHLSPEVRERVRREHRDREKRIVGLIRRGVEAGTFEVEDPVLVSNAIGGMVRAVHRWYDPAGRLGTDQICRRMATLALNLVRYAPPRPSTRKK